MASDASGNGRRASNMDAAKLLYWLPTEEFMDDFPTHLAPEFGLRQMQAGQRGVPGLVQPGSGSGPSELLLFPDGRFPPDIGRRAA